MVRRSRVGFTMAELLVVIAIIALLVAILLPTLNRAWQQARWVQCSNNERQILMAMFMYAQDNRGRLPVPRGPVLTGTQSGYAIWTTTTDSQYDYTNGSLWPYVGSNDSLVCQRLFACPADPEPRIGISIQMGIQSVPRNFSYNFNSELLNPQSPITGPHTVGVILAKVSGADHKIFVCEQGAPVTEWSDFYGYMFQGEYQPSFMATRHFGAANMGMADGHVELITPDTFPRPPGTFFADGPNAGLSASPNAMSRYLYYIELRAKTQGTFEALRSRLPRLAERAHRFY